METEFPWPHVRSLGRPHALLGDVRIFMAAVGGLVPTDGKLKSARCIPQNTAAPRDNSVLLLCRKVRTIPLQDRKDSVDKLFEFANSLGLFFMHFHSFDLK